MPTRLPRRALVRLAAGGTLAVAIMRPGLAASAAAMPIEQLSAALASAGRAGKSAAFEQRFAVLAPAVDQAFDLGFVLRASVGPHWDQLSPDEQRQLEDVFRRYTIANYLANLAGEAPTVAPETHILANGDEVVDTQVGDTKLSYVMRQGAAGWRAVDVLADGSISRVAVQRSDFRALLAQGGGPALAASLERKISELSS